MNCRIYIIKNPAKKIHRKNNKINNNVKRGEYTDDVFRLDGIGVWVNKVGLGVFVEVDVLVETGNINVMAGKGKSVVVGVFDGVAEGVRV
ncbi:MAG: hypothetical protein WAV05_18220 [Anaerolineales bacterium]